MRDLPRTVPTRVKFWFGSTGLLFFAVLRPPVKAAEGGRPTYSIVVNKANNTLKLFQNGLLNKKYVVATGLYKCTPEGTFRIIQKSVVSRSGRGPLGTHWLGLNTLGKRGWKRIGIHGTNRPSSLGTYSSLACIRMRNSDVAELYQRVPLGTKVTIVDIQEAEAPPAPTIVFRPQESIWNVWSGHLPAAIRQMVQTAPKPAWDSFPDPKLLCLDFDRDGMDEVVLVLNGEKGGLVSVWNLEKTGLRLRSMRLFPNKVGSFGGVKPPPWGPALWVFTGNRLCWLQLRGQHLLKRQEQELPGLPLAPAANLPQEGSPRYYGPSNDEGPFRMGRETKGSTGYMAIGNPRGLGYLDLAVRVTLPSHTSTAEYLSLCEWNRQKLTFTPWWNTRSWDRAFMELLFGRPEFSPVDGERLLTIERGLYSRRPSQEWLGAYRWNGNEMQKEWEVAIEGHLSQLFVLTPSPSQAANIGVVQELERKYHLLTFEWFPGSCRLEAKTEIPPGSAFTMGQFQPKDNPALVIFNGQELTLQPFGHRGLSPISLTPLEKESRPPIDPQPRPTP